MQFFSSSMNFLEHFYFLFFFIAETTFQGCFPKRYLKFQKKKLTIMWMNMFEVESWSTKVEFLTYVFQKFWHCFTKPFPQATSEYVLVTILLSQYVIFAVRFKMTLFFIGRKIIILNLQLRLIFSETKREKHFLDVVKVGRGIRRILT